MPRKYNHWNFVTVTQEAKKYRSRIAFNKGSHRAYLAALKFGIMDHLYPVVVIYPAVLTEEQRKAILVHPTYKAGMPTVETSLDAHARHSIETYVKFNVKSLKGLKEDLEERIFVGEFGESAELYFEEYAKNFLKYS